MKTKQQKQTELQEHLDRISSNKTVIFTDYAGITAEDITSLRKQLRQTESQFKVSKKRLLNLALKQNDIDVDPTEFEGQLGVIFSPQEIFDIAGDVFKFAKEHKTFKVLGGYNIDAKEVLDFDYMERLSSLPSREVLLGQLVGMVSAPLRMMMLTLTERAKSIN